MIQTDRAALVCDFAETYHIYEFGRLPLMTVATLAVGLRDNSRIKMKMAGTQVTLDTQLLCAAVDRLSLLVWSKTKDAEKGRNRPMSILEAILHEDVESDTMSFVSGEEFMAERARLIGGDPSGD